MDIPPTNMYNKTPPDNLNQILADLSIGDTKHDFGLTQGQFSDIKSSYDKGLPPPGTTDKFPSEEKCLSSVVAKLNGSTEEAYVPMNVANPTYISGTNNEHTITSINGYEYNVTYTDVKPNKTIISAKTFYDNLKLSETDIAIVVDAASISFIEILSKGKILVNGTRPKVYYIYGAEVVNDPATKKHPDSLFNKKENEGVNLISCISTNPSSFVYPYTFDETLVAKTTYLNQFFTNYNFGLSEIIPTIKGKSTNYTTNLTVTDKTDGALINPLVDSKSKNDISFLTKVIEEIKSRLFKKSNLQKTFLLNSSYQQKRSGDWLQVLLCSALRDKSRGIKDYSKKNNINIIDRVQRVFFVTHDRIALAFALLNGIDCIFTHHHSTTHFHSAFVYKLNDPIQTAANESKFANDVKDILSVESKGSKLKVSLTEIISLITEYIENKYTTSVTTATNNLDTTITAKVADTSVLSKVFDKYVKDIFTKALIVIFYKNIAPDLSVVLADFRDAETNFDNLFVGMDNKQVIRKYNELQTKIDSTKAIITKANTNIEKSSGEKSINMISFKKSSIYKYADTWKWDTSLVKNRDLSRISNIMDPTIYGADRNIFLYNINDLPVDIKRKITTIFYGLYERIMNMPMETQTVQDNRFKAIASSFCVEVLLTLGSGGGVSSSDITAQRIIDTMDSYMNKKDKLSVSDAETESAVEIPINALLTDSVIIKEDNQYNINKSNIDVGVLQTADDGIFQIDTKQTTIPLINLVLFTKIQIENFKAITDNAIAVNTRANIRAANAIARAVNVRVANKTQQIDKPSSSGPAERPSNNGVNSLPPTTQQQRSGEPIANRIQQITDILFSKPSMGGGDPFDTTAATDNTIHLEPLHLEPLHLEELSKSLSQLPTYNKTKVFTAPNTINVFNDTSVCYHPLVPLYLFTQAYTNLINNENIAESMDFELYVNCFIFITIAKDLLINTYSTNPNTINKMSAYAIGIGLRELLFTTNIFVDRYSEVKAVVDIDDAIYSLFETLSMSVSGKITIPDNQKPEIKLFFTSKLFENFVRKLEIGKIFNNELQNITDDNIIDFVATLRKQASQLSTEIANTIIANRGSIANPKSSGVTAASARETPVVMKKIKPMTPVEGRAAKRIKISSAGPATLFGGNARRQPTGKKTKKNKRVKKYTKKGVKTNKKSMKKTKKHRRKRNKHTRKH